MRNTVVSTVKAAARAMGIKVERYTLATSPELRLTRMLARHNVDLVIDVGASTGGYGHSLRMAGYQGRILSFEPLPSAHAALVRRSASHSGWAVAPPMALGAHEGRSRMNVAGNSDSSSLLEMLDSHATAAPDSRYVAAQEVVVARLDQFRHPFIEAAARPFLKVDTQGYEEHVLAGAAGVLPQLCGVQVEMTLEPLYEGQMLWHDLMAMIDASGFQLWSIVPGFFDQHSGRLLQCDGIFFRAVDNG
jgi:FkbM family methyltransferase